ncbi:hypothetical protein F503_03610 [Ophiostoma piceae UAMH 11346]|uniref:Uncharacterized protein n=1 Tax=Ophiostoma piceae (strain UAMH 11346) TaxID=1262450 RepID=S3CDX7_OPHP1|nr:hypothetical protein F503_03610 [Ophiostoma piceae UAMH 11346]
MPGKSEPPRRRGPATPLLKLDVENLSIDHDDDMVEDVETGAAEAQITEGQDGKKNEEDMDDGTTLTLREELELFGNPPPSPRGLPTGRSRRTMQTPVGFVPTTNDRYLNPMREHYVPHRDPQNSPFAGIPFSYQTEHYRAPRQRGTRASGRRTSTVRRRPSGILRSNGLPPLPPPLRYENPIPARPRIPSSSRPTPRSASSSAAAAGTSSSSNDKDEKSTSKKPSRKD